MRISSPSFRMTSRVTLTRPTTTLQPSQRTVRRRRTLLLGFNAGSATAADFVAGQAMLVTQIASASGVIGWTAVERACYRRPSSLGMISGAISGLVGITPASGSVGAMGAIFIGFVTGALAFCFCTYVKARGVLSSFVTFYDINKYCDESGAFFF